MKHLLPVMVILLVGCEPQSPPQTQNPMLPAIDDPTELISTLSPYASHYLQQARSHCATALTDAIKLQESIEALLTDPQAEPLRDSQRRWLSAQDSWLACALYRFNGGPLDTAIDEDTFSLFERLGSWPISAGFVDSVPDYPYSGLVNSPEPDIKRNTLLNQHQLTATNEASVGLYVLEILLFGGNGQRSASDLLSESGAQPQSEQEPVDYRQRRRDYLQTAGALYLDDLKTLMGMFDPQLAAYPQTLRRLTVHQQYQRLMEALRLNVGSLQLELAELSKELPEYPLSNSWPKRFIQPLQTAETLLTSGPGDAEAKKMHDRKLQEVLQAAINSAQALLTTSSNATLTATPIDNPDDSIAALELKLQELIVVIDSQLLDNPANSITSAAQ